MAKKREMEFSVWVAGLILGIFALLVLGIAYFTPFSLESLTYDCWVHKRSGIYCPGCGGTRAFFAILQGDFIASFFYHPVVPYMGILYAVFMLRGAVHFLSKEKIPFMKFRMGYIYVAVGITIVQFLVKNICLLVFHVAWMR
ncbi:MAG TPA: DUF2752 domain-containing protein [Lachnospiraceae bacterium]|nr:DUF2752 domain-containing protein [Lachnospiraceae bacterium]